MPKSTIRIIAVAALFLSFTGYSFIRAYDESIWFPPDPGTPPANNVAAPVNTGSGAQIKNGPLGVDTLSVTGDVGVTSVTPQIKFDDSDSSTGVWWLHNNTYGGNPSRMHFLYDRNINGIWDAGDGNPVFIIQPGASTNGTQDQLIMPGEVHASKYCNADGSVCFDAADVGTTSTSTNATGGKMQFLGYFTSPEITLTIPPGIESIVITPTASAACNLPGDIGSGAALAFLANGTQYSLLRADGANNNGGYTSITASTNGVVDVSKSSSVALTIVKKTYGSDYISLNASGGWSSTVQCPTGDPIKTTFFGYTIYGVGPYVQAGFTVLQSASLDGSAAIHYVAVQDDSRLRAARHISADLETRVKICNLILPGSRVNNYTTGIDYGVAHFLDRIQGWSYPYPPDNGYTYKSILTSIECRR